MFHVFTHAFFKCMLFLGAGAVIHAVHSNDIGDMGGLRTRMPKTYWSMLVACLAIGGIFPFSGFWSKDEILLAALQSGHYCTFFLGLLTGGLTAFYMFRLFFLTFHGNPRSELHGVHEDPWMTFSIVALTIPTVLGGLAMGLFGHHVLPPMELPDMHGVHSLWLPFLASLVGLGGIGLAWYMYGESDFSLAAQIRRRLEPVYVTVYNKFYIDELYLYITRQIIFRFVAAPIKWFDRHIVDGTMDLVGLVLQVSGRGVRLVQNGQLQFYLGVTVVGLVVLLFLGVL
jgi:NADH-quinone oxidoreductase subunit L